MSERHVKLDGVELSVEDRGAGSVMVLVHGFPLDRAMWAAQIEALASEFRVIAPDLRGFGQSSLDAGDVEQGVGMERYAADVAAVLDDWT